MTPQHYIIMGPAGCGKTTIGKRLADQLTLPFIEGDHFHSPSNLKKMGSEIALTDEDRQPWLELLNQELLKLPRGAVLACSALKAKYRITLTENVALPVHWIYLETSYAELDRRLKERPNHIMKAALLDSQLDDLEPPVDGLTIRSEQPIDAIIKQILHYRP